jgi:hypothetical protein
MVDMNVGVGSNWPCMFCPPDDDTVIVGDSASHKVFTETFCERLSFSGSPNLANAHHCSFTFLEQPGHKAAPVEAIRHKDKTSQAFLSITGLPKKLSKKDLAIIDASAIEAYKDAYEGHSLKSISARGIIDMPKKSLASKQCINCPSGDEKLAWPCMFCPPDDDSFELTADEGKIILLDVEVGAQWPCMFCPPDDDSFELASPDLKYVNTAFSKALCSKLRNSGSTNLAKADDCAMEFFYEPSTSK